MYEGISKLAAYIKIIAADVSKEDAWWKEEYVGPAIGLPRSDEFFSEISVTDDSGYRAITIGDTRGNVSSITGKRIPEKAHKGYMLLYYENCSYDKKGGQVWKHPRFPSQKEIAEKLQKILDEEPLIPMDQDNGDSEDVWYERRDKAALKYLSGVVNTYADAIARDKRTPQQIFEAVQKMHG